MTMEAPPIADKDAIAIAVNGSNDEDNDDSEVTAASGLSGMQTPASERSMELFARSKIEEGKGTSAEKVMDKSRRYKKIEGVIGVGTDDTEDITAKFANKVKGSAIHLRIKTSNKETFQTGWWKGSAGILRKDGVLKLATCKHNISTTKNDVGQILLCLRPHELTLADGGSAEMIIPHTGYKTLPRHALELRGGISWKSGVDVALGPIINDQTGEEIWPNDPDKAFLLNAVLGKISPIDVVGDDFEYVEGMKIGVIVNNQIMADEKAFTEVGGLDDVQVEHTYDTMTQEATGIKIAAICGQKNDVKIYTGHISYVGKKHIEYNANTYKGCSGAVTVVMEREHKDFGKALSLHAGFKKELQANIGFKLAGAFDGPFFEEGEE